MWFFFLFFFIFLLSARRRLQRAVKAGNQRIPLNSTQVKLVLVAKVDGAESASRRAGADGTAVANTREALKVFAIGRKRAGVVVEGRGQLVARLEIVDVVGAGAGCVGAGA